MTNNNIPDAKVLVDGVDLTPYIIPGSAGWTEDGLTAEVDMSEAGEALDQISGSLDRFSASLGDTAGWDQFLKAFAQEAFSPREELAHRIQCAIDGVDPGEPLNRGSDGWKVWS